MVFSDDTAFIEHAVVRGYLAAAKKRRDRNSKVIVRAPQREMSKIPIDSALIEHQPDTSDEWEVSFYRSLFSADGVLLMGGGRSTHIAGILALTNGIPLVPLAAFGGSTTLIWSKMKAFQQNVADADIALLGRQWGSNSARNIVDVLNRQYENRDRSEGRTELRQRRRQAFGSVTAILTLVLAAATLVLAQSWRGPLGVLTLLMAGPMLGSVAGALLRDAVAGANDNLWAAARGLGAGMLSAMLYVASQLLAVPDLIDNLDARRLLWFVVPLGIAAGLTFEAVYAKVRDAQVDVAALTTPTSG